MSCSGNGECFQQCDYDCYEKRLECAYNCELRPCNNFIICQKKYPQWYLNCHNGCDTHCDMQYGPLKFLDEETECCICFEHKKMIQLLCNHKFCLDCIKKHVDGSYQNKCPLCRNVLYMHNKCL
mgnify:FL=1